jgi:mannan endo-1,4-beta-mannosidase
MSGWLRVTARKRFGPLTYVVFIIAIAILIRAAIVVIGAASAPSDPVHPTQPVSYLGVYEPDAPASYAGIDQFAHAIGRQPNLVLYYSHWLKPFDVNFATAAAKRGAVTIVQIAPNNISLASIVSGRYDAYLRSYALAVKAFGARVILSFGHEMNGNWNSYGFQHTSPTVFVAAWRHVVTIFRMLGVKNVTWLWTINIVDNLPDVTNPAPWWPGRSYVNWVGVDGYFYGWSETFASLFGATIADVRDLTSDPILIAETGASLLADQPAKIDALFAGVRTFGLLGFVLFDQNGLKYSQSWRIDSRADFAALRQQIKAHMKSPTS